MTKMGRPPLAFPRRTGIFVRFSDTEIRALKRAIAADHPVAARRPTIASWLRDLAVARAGNVLGVEVTRGAVKRAARPRRRTS